MESPAFGAATLTNCDREPIHTPGAVQPHGALLAIDPTSLRIAQAGGATIRLLGAPADAMIGMSADMYFSVDQVAVIREMARPGRSIARAVHAFTMAGAVGCGLIDVLAHLSSGLLILECEVAVPEDDHSDPLALVQAMNRHLHEERLLPAFCDAVVREFRAMSGFDRVLMYRFQRDGTGTVIAESLATSAAPFLGLRFPESDIPKQARRLYLTNWLRLIPNARYVPSPLVSSRDAGAAMPLDLSHSVIRAVSPLHLQYLANMGVVASMSLSLVLRGHLWGMIACHHGAPRFLKHRTRLVYELFAQTISSLVETKLLIEEADAEQQMKGAHDHLLREIGAAYESRPDPAALGAAVRAFLPGGGAGLWIDGRFTGVGTTPDAGEISALVAWLNETAPDGIFHTDCLSRDFPPAASFAAVASGLLAIAISRSPRDYVFWFRPEVLASVTWGGNPDKPIDAGAARETLTPRTSFAAWREPMRLHALPWADAEIAAAHRLRLALLELVLRRLDEVAREREVARLEQARLAAERDQRMEQWREVAIALKAETERRVSAESDLSRVLHRTVTDQEAERRRIARELHDTLGQGLSLLQLGLEGIDRAVAASPEIRGQIAALKALMHESSRDLNRLAWEIRPTALDDLGIETAVRNFVERWSELSGVAFDVHLTLGGRRLAPDVETTLYRVLQEALTNVVRHAEAKKVGIVLSVSPDAVTMIIEDNGGGYETDDSGADSSPGKRLGLLGVRERLSLVGGSLEVESASGAGTALFIRIPV